ncbi:C40 family peptidase [Streptomyces halobius]|uniref:Bifunctional lytic transglycosylase/C40 family peptidase n=1 Tax=Streptomyces halobius TaxID=2879846 RepID=A0ABY4MIP3_9ACTN|nr:bifunctional lytic transglycosylase/C40 family peptidase [Streptomyces halobius]UQA97500.1 bifunctional lytic transglycosylase/C40 family peptidase [Streptomyces halobius]
MKKPVIAVGVGFGAGAVALIGVLVLFIAAVANGAAGHQEEEEAAGSQISAQGGAVGDIPPDMLALYRKAAPAACRGLDWTVLAAIGKVETDHARHPTMRSYAGAVGPMQFLPTTFKGYAYPVPPGGANPPSPWDPTDAVYAAARMLCANGAKSGTSKGIYKAIYSYNHADWYVKKVLAQAKTYAAAQPNGIDSNADVTSNAIVKAAYTQLGVPYVWGGGTINGPSGGGFDCSGLTSYAVYQGTGHKVVLPRTSQEQRHVGKSVPRDQMQPGDLIIFNKDGWGHVGIYAGGNRMIDAPRPGKRVEIISLSGYWEQYAWDIRRVA